MRIEVEINYMLNKRGMAEKVIMYQFSDSLWEH